MKAYNALSNGVGSRGEKTNRRAKAVVVDRVNVDLKGVNVRAVEAQERVKWRSMIKVCDTQI